MAVVAFGLNHNTAPVAIREQAAIAPDQLEAALADLNDLANVVETVILSTCNRTEIYCELRGNGPPLDWFAKWNNSAAAVLRPYLFSFRDAEAVRQLLRVASSLDSMVVGEPQILGQLKAAYRAAQAAGTVGPILNRLLQYSFAVAKQIRTTTAIGENPVSVAFAAVRLAQQILGELDQSTALLIGAGETIELVARHLVESSIGQLIVSNRTFARSRALAERFGAYAAPFDAIATHLAEVDIVISATASPQPIITRTTMATALRARKHRPVFLLDMAVPRDIETAVGELRDAYLYTVDDLKVVIEDNRRSRQVAARQAEEIVAQQVETFMRWKNSLNAVPAILSLRQRAERDRDELLVKAQRQLRRGDNPEEVVRRLADSLVKRLTHAPSVRLKEAGAQQNTELLEAARELLDLTPLEDV